MGTKDKLLYGLFGVIVGISSVWATDHFSDTKFDPEEAVVYDLGKPAIMRISKDIGEDTILVDGDNDGKFQTIEKYLDGFRDKADRIKEEKKIKSVIEAYDSCRK